MNKAFIFGLVFAAGILVAVVGMRVIKPAEDRIESTGVLIEELSFVLPPDPDRERVLESYVREIRDLDFDYGKVGSVLEAIGYLELKRRFPAPQYAVVPSVQYFNHEGRTVGELDLVVVDVEASRAVVVYEAKLTGNPGAAGGRAAEQIERFRRTLRAGEVFRFQGRPGDLRLGVDHFRGDIPMLRMGTRETESYGWEAVMDITRSEGDIVQSRLGGARRY